MANKVGWGQGSVNNNVGWGQGASNNDIGWGNIQAISPSGETNIVGGGGVDERFIITVKTDNAGTSSDTQFTIPTSTTGITQAFLYDIETSDGQTITGNTGDTTITFPSAGEYDIFISGSFPYIYFNNSGDRQKLLDIKNFGIYALGSTSQNNAFLGCSEMDISATDSGYFGSVNNFYQTLRNCTSLTSFPLLDTSSGTEFRRAWNGCSSLTSFPSINTSSGTLFNEAWFGCTSLTSFPLIDTSSSTDFKYAWTNCSSLATFPANAFDNNIATNYSFAFLNTALTATSIDDILVSLDTNGVSNGTFTQSGGQAPSATGEAAIDSLVGKGWTITVTGGYTPPQLLLDEYPNAAAAYSLRDLASASVGSAVVRVRRSSDNAEQDFTATEITDGTLTTFTGANDGFVTTWYDQSGNGKDTNQSTASKQPKLVTSGVVEMDNGKPTILFDGINDVLENTSLIFPTTNICISKVSSRIGTSAFDSIGYLTSGGFLNINNDSRISFDGRPSGGASFISDSNLSPTTEQILQFNIYDGANLKASANGGDFGTTPVSANPISYGSNELYIGALPQYNNFTNCNNSEFIMWGDDQTSNKLGIETNINNNYTIY